MLRTSPWNRLPLTIRWLKQEHQLQFDPMLQPPTHMPIEFGPVKSIKVRNLLINQKKIAANEGHLQPVHWYSLVVKKLRRFNYCRTRTYGKILLSDVVKQY